ncbi:MAG: phage major capsid protein [Anaerolineaceae bacterium]|nr:MAG: phage major capsid protein [Anaerolineaceae bacterium]
MSQKLKALLEERAKLVTESRTLLDAADVKVGMTAEQNTKYEELSKRIGDLGALIAAENRQIELEREMAATADQRSREKGGNKDKDQETADLVMKGLRSWLKNGTIAGEGAAEFRALSVGTDTEGGYLTVPEQFIQQLIKAVDNLVFVRRRATVIPVPTANSLGVPTLDADPADADWTTELLTGNEDSTMAFGKRSLVPHPFAKRIKISKDLLRKSLIPAETLVMQRLSYKFAVTEEQAFLTGSGVARPLGIFTAHADGIPTSRDVSTGNTTTSITFDGLIEAKYAVKSQYWPRASWVFHRDAMKQISKLKDGEGQYLWRPSVRDGEPDTILQRPMDISEYAPNTFTTGLYVGMFGDFSNYWIADAYSMQMQRLEELYAEANQVGFIARQECDGMPVLSEAFARVKLA